TSSVKTRDAWGSRLGVILAVSGSAVGLGNFLRFPSQAAANGGGAFMVPYFIAFLLLGIPLAWIEWTLGRYGGRHNHGTGPGVFHRITSGRPWAKYLGIVSILVPTVITFYYVYIEGWTLAFSYFALTGAWDTAIAAGDMGGFFGGFIAVAETPYFNGPWAAIIVFGIVFVLNYWIIYHGISRGIEKLAKIGMPILIFCGLVLAVRVLTLGAPDANHPDWNVTNALGFMWNPDWSSLSNAKVWIAAAGQIFFTLSVGMGCIMAYSSYLKSKDDVVLSSLTSSSTNEFVEVILGGSVGIVAAAVFYGAAGAQEIAQGGSFSLGFVTMPLIFAQMTGGAIFGLLWFFLLFVAGITSSVSLIQPAITFLKDELDLTQKQAIAAVGSFNFLITMFLVFTMRYGTLDEMDFWAGTVLPVVSATIMVILFGYFLGLKRGFEEMGHGAQLKVPGIYRFIIKFVTPLYLIVLLSFWAYQEWWGVITMAGVEDPQQRWMVTLTRGILLLLIAFMVYVVYLANKKGKFPTLKRGEI
ncbi:sodium-dependent transporter, partial [bacterium]|nr:sodium-dependent transporter [bacterium]